MKRHAPATLRNREPILEVLRPLLHAGARVLEVASGSGEHAVFFASRMPDVSWLPSDVDPDARASIAAHRAEAALPNLAPPVVVDAAGGDLGAVEVEAVISINMIHIAPWAACDGLIRGASRALSGGGVLFLYGPFRVTDAPFAPSNEAFDASLRARDPSWGVRRLDDVAALADAVGFTLEAVIPMPANNCSVVLRRREQG